MFIDTHVMMELPPVRGSELIALTQRELHYY